LFNQNSFNIPAGEGRAAGSGAKSKNIICLAERKERSTKWPRTSVRNALERTDIRKNKRLARMA